MSLIELVFIAVSLAMDAFTVSMMYGMTIHHFNLIKCFSIAFYFGFFQSIMPCVGFYLGRMFSYYIKAIDHYIAFLFLLIIGVHMIKDASNDEEMNTSLHLFDLTVLAFATSIDALAIGITFAFFEVPILKSCLIIGIITLLLCFIALKIGQYLGHKFQNKALIIGGIILVIMAFRILIEHIH